MRGCDPVSVEAMCSEDSFPVSTSTPKPLFLHQEGYTLIKDSMESPSLSNAMLWQ